MKRVLISFIGNNDCLLQEGKEGAIISILKDRPVEILYILYNNDWYLKFASQINLYCRKFFPKLTVRYQAAYTLNPIEYNLVYPAMVTAVKQILKEEGTEGREYTISITSGTPTMHSCWVLIVQGGIIKAKMIQVSREKGVSEIDFNLDDFPQIQTDNELKIELAKKSRENKILREQLQSKFSELIGEDKSIKEVKGMISNLSRYDIPVFIGGESGTGKEVVARLIHDSSTRKEHPFISVNCGSISEKLFESEFFGHKKGAFTGAIDNHNGHFREANSGTLFLDEVGDLPLSMQVKLLRVLESGEIQPVGGKTKKVNVRIITASNKDLSQMVSEGTFREDLYWRIVQVKIELTPLRERSNDILVLANHFLKDFSTQNKREKRLSADAEKKLLKYHFPGNVRQLQNIIKVAYINSTDDLIRGEDILLPFSSRAASAIEIPDQGVDFDNEITIAYYKEALKKAKGNQAEAARLLKIEPHTFRARLKTLPLDS